MKRKSIVIKALPYSHKVYIRQCDYKAGEKWCRRNGAKDSLLDCLGYTFAHATKPKVFLWLRENAKLNDIVHELVHAAVYVLKDSGVPVTVSNEEALAYLVDRLFQSYLNTVERKNRAEMKLIAY